MMVFILVAMSFGWQLQPMPQRSQGTNDILRVQMSAVDERADVLVTTVQDPVTFFSSAKFLADEMGDELPLRSGPAKVALFAASLATPGSLPNPFASTRWDPSVYAARDDRGCIVGVIQTVLANVATAEWGGELRTVRFFQNVVVSANWRRRGVATKLLDFADAADDRFSDALAVEPENAAAVELYRRRGFEMATAEPERDGMRLMLRTASPPASTQPADERVS